MPADNETTRKVVNSNRSQLVETLTGAIDDLVNVAQQQQAGFTEYIETSNELTQSLNALKPALEAFTQGGRIDPETGATGGAFGPIEDKISEMSTETVNTVEQIMKSVVEHNSANDEDLIEAIKDRNSLDRKFVAKLENDDKIAADFKKYTEDMLYQAERQFEDTSDIRKVVQDCSQELSGLLNRAETPEERKAALSSVLRKLEEQTDAAKISTEERARLEQIASGGDSVDVSKDASGVLDAGKRAATNIKGGDFAGGIESILGGADAIQSFFGLSDAAAAKLKGGLRKAGAVALPATIAAGASKSLYDKNLELRRTSLEYTGEEGDLGLGLGMDLESQILGFFTGIDAKKYSNMQKELMSGGGVEFGSAEYNQGVNWATSAASHYGMDPDKAAELYRNTIVNGTKSMEDLDKAMLGLKNTVADSNITMKEAQAQFQQTINTMTSVYGGSEVMGSEAAVEMAGTVSGKMGEFGGAESVSKMISSMKGNAAYGSRVRELKKQGMSTTQAQTQAAMEMRTQGMAGDMTSYIPIINGGKTLWQYIEDEDYDGLADAIERLDNGEESTWWYYGDDAIAALIGELANSGIDVSNLSEDPESWVRFAKAMKETESNNEKGFNQDVADSYVAQQNANVVNESLSLPGGGMSAEGANMYAIWGDSEGMKAQQRSVSEKASGSRASSGRANNSSRSYGSSSGSSSGDGGQMLNVVFSWKDDSNQVLDAKVEQGRQEADRNNGIGS